MLYVGLDVHAKSVTGCILDGRTGQSKQVTWLARVMLAMLKSGEEARFTKQTRREEQAGQQTAA